MHDLISRQAAIEALKEKVFSNLTDEFYGAMQVLDELPPAQSEQSITEWQKDFREYINMLNIPRDDYKGIMEYINEVPSADVQPVVHCKDCVYWSSKETRYCNMLKGTFQENDYCSYGERKGAGDVPDE